MQTFTFYYSYPDKIHVNILYSLPDICHHKKRFDDDTYRLNNTIHINLKQIKTNSISEYLWISYTIIYYEILTKCVQWPGSHEKTYLSKIITTVSWVYTLHYFRPFVIFDPMNNSTFISLEKTPWVPIWTVIFSSPI